MTTTQTEATTETIAGYTGFKRDVLCAIAALGGTPDTSVESRPYGLAIKRQLEAWYGVEVNHGRLYPNLDDVTEDGFVKVDDHDKRTNAYALTDDGVAALRAYSDEVLDLAIDAIEGGSA